MQMTQDTLYNFKFSYVGWTLVRQRAINYPLQKTAPFPN